MLMLQMVRQMRQSLLSEEEPGEGMGGSTMQDTFDTEFSRYLARAGGVGFGALMTRTLDSRAAEAMPGREDTVSPASLPLAIAPIQRANPSTLLPLDEKSAVAVYLSNTTRSCAAVIGPPSGTPVVNDGSASRSALISCWVIVPA